MNKENKERNWTGIIIIILIGFAALSSSSAEIQSKLIDSASYALITIPVEHHIIHEGESYTYSVVSHDLDSGGAINLTIITNGKQTDLTFIASTSAAADITLYEDFSNSSVGVKVDPINRNRHLNYNSTVLLYTGQVGSSLKVLQNFHIGEGRKVGGEGSEFIEWVLDDNRVYQLVLQSEADNNQVSFTVNFYNI